MARVRKDVIAASSPDIQKRKMPDSVAITNDSSKTSSAMKWVWRAVLLLVFLGALGSSGYFYYKYRKAAGIDYSDEIKSLSESIGKTMDLPSDETPTLATVTDKSKLENQSFFKKSENGDKVLIYAQAGKAILYRPSTKKIIEVSTVNIATNENQQSDAPTNTNTNTNTSTSTSAAPVQESKAPQSPEQPTLALYNGTKTLGITYKVEEKIKEDFSDIEVTKKEPAAHADYKQTIIVDISGKYEAAASDIAKKLSAEVAALPDDETRPDADILVIIGEDTAE